VDFAWSHSRRALSASSAIYQGASELLELI